MECDHSIVLFTFVLFMAYIYIFYGKSETKLLGNQGEGPAWEAAIKWCKAGSR